MSGQTRGRTAGRAARDAWYTAHYGDLAPNSYATLTDHDRASWEAVARAARQPLRDALAAEIEALEAEACTVHPSRLSEFKRAEAARLRQILEGAS